VTRFRCRLPLCCPMLVQRFRNEKSIGSIRTVLSFFFFPLPSPNHSGYVLILNTSESDSSYPHPSRIDISPVAIRQAGGTRKGSLRRMDRLVGRRCHKSNPTSTLHGSGGRLSCTPRSDPFAQPAVYIGDSEGCRGERKAPAHARRHGSLFPRP